MRILDLFLIVLIVVLCVVVWVRPPVQSKSPQLHAHTSVTFPSLNSPLKSPLPNSPQSPVDFYQSIIDTNLFRPLGFRPNIPSQPYRLIGTRIGSQAKAFILDTRSNQLFSARVGEKIGDVILKQIHPKRVILQSDDKQIRLELDRPIFY